MGEVRFMISEAAKQVDVESHVLRYWEEELGLAIGRTEMGHRYYTNDDIQLFCCIKKLKDEGMLLRDLKPLIPELKATKLRLKSGDGNAAPAKADALQEPAVPGKPGTSKAAAQEPAESGDVVVSLEKLEQVQALFGDVFREVLRENNGVLKKDISSTVTADVMHEMDFLLQAKDRRQEEHFRRLDALIRQQQTSRKDAAKTGPLMKLRKIFT
ncbi:MAG TPA: helix-turn-helix domain-containing protein [Candidatus Mediterraneibacter merdipullorum]|nr:helix-turn-helix domain-containing protein [Candidatus Mediterraneibacter merdipullorum]